MNPHIRSLSEKSKIFCNYCDCEECRHGDKGLYHALTINGDYICDICYNYHYCGCNNSCKGGCVNRVVLISDWKKYPGHFK